MPARAVRRSADAHQQRRVHRGRLHLPQHAAEAADTSTSRSTWRRFSRAGRTTFRTEQFADYKANRTEMPPDLSDQIPLVRQIARGDADSDPRVSRLRGGRRDRHHRAAGAEESGDVEVVIVSSDKDMLQLVTDRVSHAEPDEGRHLVRRRQRRPSSWAFRRRPSPTCSRLEGRFDRQHPGRAGDRRQGRARI